MPQQHIRYHSHRDPHLVNVPRPIANCHLVIDKVAKLPDPLGNPTLSMTWWGSCQTHPTLSMTRWGSPQTHRESPPCGNITSPIDITSPIVIATPIVIASLSMTRWRCHHNPQGGDVARPIISGPIVIHTLSLTRWQCHHSHRDPHLVNVARPIANHHLVNDKVVKSPDPPQIATRMS